MAESVVTAAKTPFRFATLKNLSFGAVQRQQLWNYMRLTKVTIGILINFAPAHDQCEHYYLDTPTNTMFMF